MAVTNASNLTVGQAVLYFAEGQASEPNATKQADTTTFGNITVAEITPDVSYAEHFISVKGNRRKDKEVAISKTISIPFTFDELSDENIRKFMMGRDITATQSVVMDKNTFEGRAILNFQTNVGNHFIYYIPKCNLKSDGGLGFSSEDWMTGNFVIEVLYSDTYRIYGDPSATKAPYGYLDHKGLTILQNIVENGVNCWNTLANKAKAISSQVREVILEKVQRLTSDSYRSMARRVMTTRVPCIL